MFIVSGESGDGTIDVIATDHAPHATHEKQQEFTEAPFGIVGLETALPLSLKLVEDGVARPREGSFGLVGMRERAGMLGGRVEFGNAAGGGARLVVHLPLAPDEEDRP